MQSDYLWVRYAPIEEGVKVRYLPSHAATMGSILCMTALPTPQNALK